MTPVMMMEVSPYGIIYVVKSRVTIFFPLKISISMIGIYTVLCELDAPADIQVGKRLRFSFEKGFYGYVGSALTGLERRLERHLRKQKKLHWHIDFLLDKAQIQTAIYAETSEKKECLIAQALSRRLRSIVGFGCTDCACTSHLFFSDNLGTLERHVINAFKEVNLNPKIERFTCLG